MKARVKLNLRGINQVMRGQDVQDLVDAVGEGIAGRAGDGFEYVSRPGRFTARGYVQVNSGEGARRQAADAVLERAIGGA